MFSTQHRLPSIAQNEHVKQVFERRTFLETGKTISKG